MSRSLRPRPGGPTASVALDTLRWARHTRAVLLLIVVALVVLAVAIAGAGQVVVPWLIYGGL
ncbi:MAG: hypothetical protein ACKOYM_01120 [Actinomycetes bacterium]